MCYGLSKWFWILFLLLLVVFFVKVDILILILLDWLFYLGEGLVEKGVLIVVVKVVVEVMGYELVVEFYFWL